MLGVFRFVLILLFPFSVFAAEAVVQFPCDTAPFIKCADLKKEFIEGVTDASGKVVEPGLKKIVREMMDDVYSGKVKVTEDGTGSCLGLGLVGKPPICPPIPLPQNGCVDEFTKNSKGEQCKPISKVGLVSVGKTFFSLGKFGTGSLETSNLAGGLVVALSSMELELSSQLTANRLVVPSTSACYTKANALVEQLVKQKEVKLLSELEKCDVSGTGTCSAKRFFDANAKNLQAASLRLAKCVLIEGAERKFREFALDFSDKARDVVLNTNCLPNNRDNVDGLVRCYATQYTAWVKGRARNIAPNVQSACAQGAVTPPPNLRSIPVQENERIAEEQVW